MRTAVFYEGVHTKAQADEDDALLRKNKNKEGCRAWNKGAGTGTSPAPRPRTGRIADVTFSSLGVDSEGKWFRDSDCPEAWHRGCGTPILHASPNAAVARPE